MKARFIFAALLAAVLLMPAQGSAQDRSNVRLAESIVRTLNHDYTRITIFDDVNITVEGGVATLTGKVTMPYKKNDIGARSRSKCPPSRATRNRSRCSASAATNDPAM
jgi:hypothetical protein